MTDQTLKKLQKLSPTKRALLIEAMRREAASAAAAADAPGEPKLIRRRTQSASAAPLSFAQQRLWFLEQLAPGSATYNIPLSVRLSGQLDVDALRHGFEEVIKRHEILRTSFTTEEGEPVQVVHAPQAFKLPLVDLSELPAPQREAETRRLATTEAARPFDLAVAPLMRVVLIRLAETEHVALLTMHHIISDGWSMRVFLRELSTLYEAYWKRQESPLSELPIQYADYAVWQRDWLQGEVLETQLSYWRNQLAGAPAYLDLPTDHPRPAVQSFRGAFETFNLSAELSEQLKSLSRREGATLFMTLLAAFKLLLYRYSWQEDVLVGTAVANRNQRETEELIGFFVNMLVLRTDLGGNPTFVELLARVRHAAVEAYAHQDVPFEKLVEELQPERDLAHTPLFQVVFVLQNMPMPALELSGVRLTPQKVESGTAPFDLTLTMEEAVGDGGALAGTLEYNTDVFKAETITRMLKNFTALLEEIATHPQRRVLDIPVGALAAQASTDAPLPAPPKASVVNPYEGDQFRF